MKQTVIDPSDRPAAVRRKPWLSFAPAVLWMAVIYMFSSRTGDELNTFLPWFQKLFPWMTGFDWGHFVAYFILGLAFDFGFGPKADRIAVKLFIIGLCLVYGVTDEFHQSFVGGRMPDVHDLRNDMIGAALAVGFTAIPAVRKHWRRLAR